jgi:hypothetical protein
MNTALLIAICVAVVGAVVLMAITTHPRYREARKRSRQRRVINRLKRALPGQLGKEKERLCALWDGNPAAQCAAIFNGFRRPAEKADSREELADRVDRAIDAASALFEQNFMSRYADVYSKHLVVRTTELANELAARFPENVALILQRLAQNDEEISRRFNESICDALSEGEGDREPIRAHIRYLMQNSDRFRRLLTPGFFQKYSKFLVGGGAAVLLRQLGIESAFLEYKAGQLAAGMWDNLKNKAEQEFGDSFITVLWKELPILCEHVDAKVRESLSRVVDRYIEDKLKQQREILDFLLELSRAKCDVESGICWFRNAISSDTRSTLASWSGLFAGAGVLVFIAAAFAVWLYSPHATKAPATNPLPENKEVTAIAAKSQIDTAVALAGAVTSTSANQPSPAPTAAITPETPNASGMLRPTEVTVGQKKTAIEQGQHPPVHSGSPAAGKYPVARRAERPGFYYSPYTGRVYDLRRVADGGLVRDPDTGQFFRRPWHNNESDSHGR